MTFVTTNLFVRATSFKLADATLTTDKNKISTQKCQHKMSTQKCQHKNVNTKMSTQKCQHENFNKKIFVLTFLC